MTSHPTVEERLSTAFGVPMTVVERAVLDDRITPLFVGAPSSSGRFRLHVTRSLLLVAALLILLPTILVVGAAMFSTEAPYGMGNADQYDAEVAAAKAVTPIPPGATWPSYLERAEDRSASYGIGLGQSMVEYNAYCLWLGYWYEAQDGGDSAGVSVAATVLDDARGWESFTDPLRGDEGFRNGIQRTIDAVESGDAPVVLRELNLNCLGTWPPATD